ncbi:hypothetical protein GOP47_0028104 [Adiantum capillus-veneris]|nr:hypothetical protein GOP47_0028104 [Adiantum capillus-veneris]
MVLPLRVIVGLMCVALQQELTANLRPLVLFLSKAGVDSNSAELSKPGRVVDAQKAGAANPALRLPISYRFWSPDCVEKLIISINGQSPGPTIRVREGDTIKVEVENLMPTEGVVIHWHGIHQRGSPWYDGTGAVSQCAIAPGETFVYKFLADKAGTYFYHGHLGLQRSAGFYGSLIVEVAKGVQEPFQYDGELSIILNDWWHKSAIEQGLGLFSDPFRWVGEPQSLLMNGRGQYECSLIEGGPAALAAGDRPPCNASSEQCAPLVLRVQPGRIYRLRIASVTSLSYLNFQIEVK